MSLRTQTLRIASALPAGDPTRRALLEVLAENWIPKDLEKGRCTPGSPNYDCPEGSPQWNLAQTFKKHPEWGEKGGKKASGEYNGDPNVALESVVYEAQKRFVEDVARAVLRYSTLRTPLQGKGNVFMRGGVAHGGVVNRTGETEIGLGIEVKVNAGKILVELSDLNDQNAKKHRFSSHETPASIGATLAGVGREYLGF